MDADANGARLVCGSHDYKCYLYDFGGLKADGKSFRSWEVSVGTCSAASCLWGHLRCRTLASLRSAACSVLHPGAIPQLEHLRCHPPCCTGDGGIPGGCGQLVAHRRRLLGGHFIQPGMQQAGVSVVQGLSIACPKLSRPLWHIPLARCCSSRCIGTWRHRCHKAGLHDDVALPPPVNVAAQGVQPRWQGAGGAAQGRHVHTRHEEHQRRVLMDIGACGSYALQAGRQVGSGTAL